MPPFLTALLPNYLVRADWAGGRHCDQIRGIDSARKSDIDLGGKMLFSLSKVMPGCVSTSLPQRRLSGPSPWPRGLVVNAGVHVGALIVMEESQVDRHADQVDPLPHEGLPDAVVAGYGGPLLPRWRTGGSTSPAKA